MKALLDLLGTLLGVAIPLGAAVTAFIPYGFHYLGWTAGYVVGCIAFVHLAFIGAEGPTAFGLAYFMGFTAMVFLACHIVKALAWVFFDEFDLLATVESESRTAERDIPP